MRQYYQPYSRGLSLVTYVCPSVCPVGFASTASEHVHGHRDGHYQSLSPTVSKRNYCTPYGIVLHAFPVMSYILLMKYQVGL